MKKIALVKWKRKVLEENTISSAEYIQQEWKSRRVLRGQKKHYMNKQKQKNSLSVFYDKMLYHNNAILRKAFDEWVKKCFIVNKKKNE